MQAKLSRRGVVSGIAVAPVLPATLMQKESRLRACRTRQAIHRHGRAAQ